MVLVALAVSGCCTDPPVGEVQVPEPINLLLPREIRVHPFTEIHRASGDRPAGVDVRVEAVDSFGDTTKALGTFRFEVYTFRAGNTDPKGRQLAIWDIPVASGETNLLHWDSITRTYSFPLEWNVPIEGESRFVVVGVFTSPFTPRLMHERVVAAR
jgi:hypothetical protein